MHTKEKQIAHIQMKREAFELDLQFILKKGQLTIEHYNHILFERGCEFVEREMKKMYPAWSRSKQMSEALTITSQRFFWDWWMAEYKEVDNYIVRKIMGTPTYFMNPRSSRIFMSLYYQEFQQYIAANYLTGSFNYILEKIS